MAQFKETGHHPQRSYVDQQGGFHPNGAAEYDAFDNPLAMQVTISAAPNGANVTNITFQLKDGAGNNCAEVIPLDIWLSDAATGIGLTASTASGAVQAGTSGTDLGALTVKKALRSITDATGKYILSITDTVKTLFFPCCTISGTGKIFVGAQLITANYG
jgi:hypothetical protein